MRQQDRHDHAAENGSRDPSENKLPKPGVAVSTEDNEVSAALGGMREWHISSIDVEGDDGFQLNPRIVRARDAPRYSHRATHGEVPSLLW